MESGWQPKRDVTAIFIGGSDMAEIEDALEDEAGPVYFFDPLGLLERRTSGRVRDPVRAKVKEFLARLSS